MISPDAFAEMVAIRRNAAETAELSRIFFETTPFRRIRSEVFGLLEAREARLKLGQFEQKGMALIGPAGSGKSRLLARTTEEYEQIAEATGGRNFGHKVVSVIQPGQASVKDTCRAILDKIGYPVDGIRTEDYLIACLRAQLEHRRIAAIHLDEVQDAGRHATAATMSSFAKRFRNLMQSPPWPVTLILSSTPEGRDFINHDFTLTRRLRTIEILPMTFEADGTTLKYALEKLIVGANLEHDGLIEVPELLRICMHGAAYRFGIALELTVEAIAEAKADADCVVGLNHYAAAYYGRMSCDDEMNPFISEHWRAIDTTRAMDRYLEEREGTAPRRKRK